MTAEKTLCFTGHRIIAKEHYDVICDSLEREIEKYIAAGYTHFLSGGARGFDLLCAMKVIKARKHHKDIKLIMVLPCRDQTAKWKVETDIYNYNKVLEAADEIIYTSYEYDSGCMHKRNRYMVDASSAVIAYMARQSGGTYVTYKYAKTMGREIVNIAPNAELVTQLTIE